MEMRQLRYFLDIAQTEHLTQSAQNLFVTQSTLSHGLRQLEQELEIQLFDRLGRGLRLSQAGAAFRVHAARALQEIEAGRMALADMTGLQSGALTVGVIHLFAHPGAGHGGGVQHGLSQGQHCGARPARRAHRGAAGRGLAGRGHCLSPHAA